MSVCAASLPKVLPVASGLLLSLLLQLPLPGSRLPVAAIWQGLQWHDGHKHRLEVPGVRPKHMVSNMPCMCGFP